LGGDIFDREFKNFAGRKVYLKHVDRSEGRSLSVGLAVIAQPRNVPAAISTMVFLTGVGGEAAFLCGIGGGVKGKVSLGDVVISSSVIDVAGGRSEPGRVGKRNDPFAVPLPILRQVEYFVSSRVAPTWWRAQLLAGAERLISTDVVKMPAPQELTGMPFNVDDGIIVAGEQLVADGSLPTHLQYDDRIRSCDMEGSGFAQSCNEKRVNWGVFRGISDYGDPVKTDEWQGIAAFAAVRAALHFLSTEFRLNEEMQGPMF
jgi:nucleoside phosphorylase